MKALSGNNISYKSMGIFQTPNGSLVCSGRILTASKTLWLSLLPVRMKKIKLKIKALEWSQHYILIFRHSMAANSGGGILTKFKLSQSCMGVLVTCMIEENPYKNEGTRVVTTFLPL